MIYTDICNAALLYVDRTNDLELAKVTGEDYSNLNYMLRVVEATINRVVTTRKSSKRAFIVTSTEVEFYSLPCDFAGLREATIVDGSNRTTLQYVTPEYMNSAIPTSPWYTIINNMLKINPTYSGFKLEIIYYTKLVPLSVTNNENYISSQYPDVYIYGLIAEIAVFIKDLEMLELATVKFKNALAEINFESDIDYWSGPPPIVRLL